MSGLGYRSDLGACTPVGGKKRCWFCKEEKLNKETRYFYDNTVDVFLYACYECLASLVFKEWASREIIG